MSSRIPSTYESSSVEFGMSSEMRFYCILDDFVGTVCICMLAQRNKFEQSIRKVCDGEPLSPYLALPLQLVGSRSTPEDNIRDNENK